MNVPTEPKAARWAVNTVMALLGLVAALTAMLCFLGGWDVPGIVSVLVVFFVLCWFGIAF